MTTLRTTHTLRVRSYELLADRRAGNISFLNWFQEAAIASSRALGYGPARYRSLGLSWVMRMADLEIIERPGHNEQIRVTTWVAQMGRVTSYREYEARRGEGTLLARCSSQWVMIDIETNRPRRIPKEIQQTFEPTGAFTLEPFSWTSVSGEHSEHTRRVAFFEEDQLAHVNHANYLNWIEENARLAAQEARLPPPAFRRHLLEFHLPTFIDDCVTVSSTFARGPHGTRWEHDILRGEDLLVKGRSLAY